MHESQNDIDTQNLYNIDQRKNSTLLWLYDIKNHKLALKFIEAPPVLSYFTCILQLSHFELFCFGNYPPLSGKAYIIDLKTFNFKRSIPAGTPRHAPKAIYYNDCIYIFGGNISPEKYSIAKNRWTKLSILWDIHSDQAIALFKESILICGLHDKIIFKYDLLIESYASIDNPLLRKYIDKIMVTCDSRIYIFEWGGSILESSLLDEYNWQNIGENNIVQYVSSFWKYNDGGIFISVIGYGGGYYCYRFDLSSKKIENMNARLEKY